MRLTDKEINRIKKKYKDCFDALKEYDKAGKLPKKIRDNLKQLKIESKAREKL